MWCSVPEKYEFCFKRLKSLTYTAQSVSFLPIYVFGPAAPGHTFLYLGPAVNRQLLFTPNVTRRA